MDRIYYILVLIYDKVFSRNFLKYLRLMFLNFRFRSSFALNLWHGDLTKFFENTVRNLHLMQLNFRFRSSRARTYKT